MHTLTMRETALRMRIDALEIRLRNSHIKPDTLRHTLEERLAAARTLLQETRARIATLEHSSEESRCSRAD